MSPPLYDLRTHGAAELIKAEEHLQNAAPARQEVKENSEATHTDTMH